jgi:hypothetical protein
LSGYADDDEQIDQCLEHVRFFSAFMTLLLGIVQALDLLKTCVCNRTMEMAQRAWIAELESDNAKLQLELEQARQALVKADAAQSSLSTDQERL